LPFFWRRGSVVRRKTFSEKADVFYWGTPEAHIFGQCNGGGLAVFNRKQKLQKIANTENLYAKILRQINEFLLWGMGPNGRPGGRDDDEQCRTARPARGEPPASVPTHRHFDGCWKGPEHASPPGETTYSNQSKPAVPTHRHCVDLFLQGRLATNYFHYRLLPFSTYCLKSFITHRQFDGYWNRSK